MALGPGSAALIDAGVDVVFLAVVGPSAIGMAQGRDVMPLNFGATHTADSNVITRCHAGGVLVFVALFGTRMSAHLGRGFCLFVPTILAHTGLYLGHLILRGDRPHSKVVLTGLLLAADFAGVGMGQIAQNVNLPVSILVAARRDFFAFRRALHPAVLAMHIVKAILGAGGSLLVVNGPLVLQGRNILASVVTAVSACSASMSRLLAGRLAVVLDHLVRHRSVMSTAAIEARVPMLIPRSSRNIRAGEVVGVGVNRNRLCAQYGMTRSAEIVLAARSSAGCFPRDCRKSLTVLPSCKRNLCLYETTVSACVGLLTISTAGSVTLNLPFAKVVLLLLSRQTAAIHTQPGVAFFGHNEVAGVGVVKLGNTGHLASIPNQSTYGGFIEITATIRT